MGIKRYDRAGAAIYRTPRWKSARFLAKRRDGWACVQCGARGRLEVDHIRPIRDGGAAFDLGNLQTLCVPCHSRKTRIEIGLGKPNPHREAWAELVRSTVKPPKQKELETCLKV